MSVTMGGMLTVPAGIVEAAIPQDQLLAILALPADATAVTCRSVTHGMPMHATR